MTSKVNYRRAAFLKWFLNTINKPIRIVSIKNSKWLGILHPGEALWTKDNLRIGSVFKSNKRRSLSKRPNCPFNNPSIPFKKLFLKNCESPPEISVESEVSENISVEAQESVGHKTSSISSKSNSMSMSAASVTYPSQTQSQSMSMSANESEASVTYPSQESLLPFVTPSGETQSQSMSMSTNVSEASVTYPSQESLFSFVTPPGETQELGRLQQLSEVSRSNKADSDSISSSQTSYSYYGRSGIDASKKKFNKAVLAIPPKSCVLGMLYCYNIIQKGLKV